MYDENWRRRRRASGRRCAAAARRGVPQLPGPLLMLMLMLNECRHVAWHGMAWHDMALGVMVPCVGVDERSTIDDESTVAVGCCYFV